MFTRSIRWRLQWWLAFLLVCVLAGFGVTVHQLQYLQQTRQVDEELGRRVAALTRAVRESSIPAPGGRMHGPFGGQQAKGPGGPGFDRGGDLSLPFDRTGNAPPFHGRLSQGGPWGRDFQKSYEFKPTAEFASLFEETNTNGYYYKVWYRDGTVLKSSANAPTDLSLPEYGDHNAPLHLNQRGAYREAAHYTELGDCVVAGRSMAADLQASNHLALVLSAVGGGVLALGLGIGWWLAGRAIRPIEEISLAANRIAEGNLSERIQVEEENNELGRLARVLNSTFARLEAAFLQQKQFTADASHELRTPLAVLISETQTTLARERNAAEYRETVEACLDTAQQMRRLTESLLQLARFDAGKEAIERRPLNLAEQARTCVERLRPLAREHGAVILCELSQAPVNGDADVLEQVICNLITNAIHHGHPANDMGEIRVGTKSEKGEVVLTVTDNGPGIRPVDLPHIFERFYRADKARSRTAGHSGLGLAICKAIADAHGGTIEVRSEPDQGTTFILRLPA